MESSQELFDRELVDFDKWLNRASRQVKAEVHKGKTQDAATLTPAVKREVSRILEQALSSEVSEQVLRLL